MKLCSLSLLWIFETLDTSEWKLCSCVQNKSIKCWERNTKQMLEFFAEYQRNSTFTNLANLQRATMRYEWYKVQTANIKDTVCSMPVWTVNLEWCSSCNCDTFWIFDASLRTTKSMSSFFGPIYFMMGKNLFAMCQASFFPPASHDLNNPQCQECNLAPQDYSPTHWWGGSSKL